MGSGDDVDIRAEALRRFPAAVVDVLLEAGWRPGRQLPAGELAAWNVRLSTLREPDPYRPPVTLFASAAAVVTEFGGLILSMPPGRGLLIVGDNRWSSEQLSIGIHPYDPDFVHDALDVLDIMPTPWVPVGATLGGRGLELGLDHRGRLLAVDPEDSRIFLLADTFDEGLVHLFVGGHNDVMREVTEYGLIENPAPDSGEVRGRFLERWDLPPDWEVSPRPALRRATPLTEEVAWMVARAHVNPAARDLTLHLRSFDLGWVVAAVGVRPDPRVVPQHIGGGGLVLDRETGEWTQYGSGISHDEIIARYRASMRGRRRTASP